MQISPKLAIKRLEAFKNNDRTSGGDKIHLRKEIGGSVLEISEPWRLSKSSRKALFKNGPGTYGGRMYLLA